MWLYFAIGGGVAVLLVLVFVFSARKKGEAPPSDPKEQVKELARTGVLYEEQFVETYFKVIRDEGFMSNFGPNQDEAKRLLTIMIDESRGHKQLLENVIANLK
jgi:hypothetical protein